MGLPESLTFVVWASERRKFELLLASDVYVSTALHEGFGIVFLEAMECGLPVVCDHRGGQTETISATGKPVTWLDFPIKIRLRINAVSSTSTNRSE